MASRIYYCSILILFLSGCAVSTGVGYQFAGEPEVDLDQGIFIIRGSTTYTINDIQFNGECEHISGIRTVEDGYGMNWCGVTYDFVIGGK